MIANARIEEKPYPSYKRSGVSWTGDVPEHWEIRRLGDSAERCINGTWGEEPDGVNDLACIRVADFDRKQWKVGLEKLTMRAVTPQERPRRLLKPGDLLLEKSGGGDNQLVGVVVLYDHDFNAVTSNFVGKLEVRDGYHPKYLTYLHATLYALEINKRSIKQTTGIQNIDAYAYLSESVAYPPFEEQTAIARCLDDADQRIRAYVSAKERLIALLEEERQAVIHQAVTRGLDPNVKLKPSRVEWLGDVPEHWEVAQFARQVEIAEGQVDPKIEPYTSMLTIAPNHVESGTGRLLNRETAFEQGAISGKYICRDGDVIYSKIRPALAKVTVAPTDCLCSADMYPLRPRNPLQRDYLFWLLLSTGFTAWSTAQSERVAMPKVNRQTLNNTYIPLPPHPEQASIAQYVTEATGGTYKAIDRARRQIQLMEEYRTRLIADVVTGKIDVSRSLNPYQQDVS